MINPDLKNGEIQIQTTEVPVSCFDLKQVTPLELSNIDTNTPNVLALGFDAAVMMEIVTNSMYKDKLIACQEIPANGRDAIIRRAELGDIFTPQILINYNSSTREVKISDNGGGMSRDIIESVYRFFGRSDKRNTMNEVGMFGIGAKSVFALVDEYEVSTISMLTHKKLSFIVTKRGIIITEDEIPTEEECGTTVKFTIPKEHSVYDIKERIRRTVSTWICPVYFIEDSREYREKLSHSSETPIALSDIKNGYYKGLNETRLKYESPDFSFYLKTNGSSKIFIGHIPYEFEIDFPINIDIIMHNPNLLTLTATRESLEKDSKYNEFIKQIKLKILGILKPSFEKYFKNLDDIKNMDNKVVIFFKNFSDKDLLKEIDYPYFNILTSSYKFYDSYYHKIKVLYAILKEYNVYYTNKKLNDDTVVDLLRNLPPNSAIIICPEECNKLCMFCSEYNINYECEKDKKPFSLIRDIAKPLPVIEKEKSPRTVRNTSTFKGMNLYTNQIKKYDINNKDGKLITKEWIDTNLDSIIMVSEKIYNKLEKLGWESITPEMYPKYLINTLEFETIEGNKIKASELKKYKTIFHGLEEYNKTTLEIIKLLYSNQKKPIFLNDFIDNKNIDKIKTPTQEFIDKSEIYEKLRNCNEKLEIKIHIPVSRISGFVSGLSDTIIINNIKRLKPKDINTNK